ncbi:hypothetical protein [Paraburkholderia sediminicola]|uniref:hypothetical protein n=1 Tax=Paraburkholderia sediminicola TaxID=458836 RepID=UPI0038B781C4
MPTLAIPQPQVSDSVDVRLQKDQLEHADVLEELIGQFRDVLQILQDKGVSERNRLPKIREALGDPAEALAQCNEHIAYAGQFDLPFMLVPYRTQRSLRFQCLDVLPLQSNSQARAVLVALAWLQGFRNAHSEYLLLTDNDLANLPLDWLPEKWQHAVFPHGRDRPDSAPPVLRATQAGQGARAAEPHADRSGHHRVDAAAQHPGSPHRNRTVARPA